MSQKQAGNSWVETFSNIDWGKTILTLGYCLTAPVVEVFHGIRSRKIPLAECVIWANVLALAILLRVDRAILMRLRWDFFYPAREWTYWAYVVLLTLSGFLAWGAFQVALRARLVRRLSEVFLDAGLKSPTGKLPSFISDLPVDEFTRKLKLGRSGLSKQVFEKAKASLESGLQVFIDEIRENRERGSVELYYSHTAMPTLTAAEGIREIGALSFIVGKTRARNILATLKNVPHLLIAGQTGGGKSTFLRCLITTLYLNNKGFHFTLIDLKGGLEFQTFEGLSRATVVPSVESAVTKLEYFEIILKERMALLKANDCKDIDAFLSIPEEKRKQAPEGNLQTNLDRHLIVIDEAAEMFLAGAHASAAQIQKARWTLSQVARQGRSVGVHLVVATQRPDAKSLDPQVKANLTGVLCFQMLNDASSITVLGVGRATELPAIPGRAIWKNGAEMVEVQTPFLGVEEADRLLESERPKSNEGSSS